MTNVIYLADLRKKADIRQFAKDMMYEWEMEKIHVIDHENKYLEDEIEKEFYENQGYEAGFNNEEIRYLLEQIGY